MFFENRALSHHTASGCAPSSLSLPRSTRKQNVKKPFCSAFPKAVLIHSLRSIHLSWISLYCSLWAGRKPFLFTTLECLLLWPRNEHRMLPWEPLTEHHESKGWWKLKKQHHPSFPHPSEFVHIITLNKLEQCSFNGRKLRIGWEVNSTTEIKWNGYKSYS